MGRTFDLHVKSKYVGLKNRNRDHLPELSLSVSVRNLGATGGDLGGIMGFRVRHKC